MESDVATAATAIVGAEPRAADIALLRAAELSDHPYIVDSWMESFGSQRVARDAGRRYRHDMKWLIRALLARVPVLVACDPEEPGAIWGWAATKGDTILYCYVRLEFRRQGLGKALLAPFFATGRRVIFAAKTDTPVHIPANWDYSFLAGLRALVE